MSSNSSMNCCSSPDGSKTYGPSEMNNFIGLASPDISANGSRSSINRTSIPDVKKDKKYWERRKRNNEAARRSREKRRQNDLVLDQRINEVTTRNRQLEQEVLQMRIKYGLSHQAQQQAQQHHMSTTTSSSTITPGASLQSNATSTTTSSAASCAATNISPGSTNNQLLMPLFSTDGVIPSTISSTTTTTHNNTVSSLLLLAAGTTPSSESLSLQPTNTSPPSTNISQTSILTIPLFSNLLNVAALSHKRQTTTCSALEAASPPDNILDLRVKSEPCISAAPQHQDISSTQTMTAACNASSDSNVVRTTNCFLSDQSNSTDKSSDHLHNISINGISASLSPIKCQVRRTSRLLRKCVSSRVASQRDSQMRCLVAQYNRQMTQVTRQLEHIKSMLHQLMGCQATAKSYNHCTNQQMDDDTRPSDIDESSLSFAKYTELEFPSTAR